MTRLLLILTALLAMSTIAQAKPCTAEELESVSDTLIDQVSGNISDTRYDKLFQSIARIEFNCTVGSN